MQPDSPRAGEGVVKFYCRIEGFGYITPNDSRLGDIRVEARYLEQSNTRPLRRGDRVGFTLEPIKTKKFMAVTIKLLVSC